MPHIHYPLTMAAIQTDQLTKSYGKRRGIQDICLTVNPGEILGFLGPNGSGKSTFIRVLMGFLRPTSGTAKILGRDCWRDSSTVRLEIGYVPGDVRLYPWLTLQRALQFVGKIRGTDLRQPGHDLADRFRVEPDLPVRKMSRGNRQKVALVLALVHRPQLVIMDEPASGLDPLMQDTLADCLREMSSDGRTVLFSSHTLSEVESLCNRVAIVRDGIIVASESLAVLRSRAPRTVTVTFDSPQAAAATRWPDFVSLVQTVDSVCRLQLNGAATQLIRWAVTQPVVDMEISAPSLEGVFRGYYGGNATIDGQNRNQITPSEPDPRASPRPEGAIAE